MSRLLSPRDVILFQGDSITDCGRSRTDDQQLGGGYVALLSAWLKARYPEHDLRILNRGISGHRAKDLRARWQADCVDLQPTVVSILIGINDVWRRYDSKDATAVAAFEADYHAMLTTVRDQVKARLVLCEPFLLPCPPDRLAWREDLDPKIAAVRRLAVEFKATYIPYDGLFAAASTRQPPAYWAGDGVHPTPAGHALMAQHWLQAVGAH